jgi:hypothetical protein
LENTKERYNLEDVHSWEDIIKMALKKSAKMWTGFTWLRIRSDGRVL